MDQRSTILTLRIVACLVLMAALGGFIGELRSLPNLDGSSVLLPIAAFVAGVGISAVLLGLGAVLQQRAKSPSADASSAALAQNQMIELSLKVEDLSAAVDRITRVRDAFPTTAAHDPPAQHSAGASPDVLVALQRLFEELRDLSLLTDEQRQQRSLEMKESRKTDAVQAATDLIYSREWQGADSAVSQLEQEWPEDVAVVSLRSELESARATAATEAVEIAQAQIESEMSLSHWDRAAALARTLVREFPSSERAATMLGRVEREKGIYTESTVGRLYDEIRHDVERRIWRRALSHAQKLLEKFPDHPRSELIRKQIKTIQDNAEIEERQEQEMRIGELIRARRFREAAQLSEELLRNFPNSPQADAIQKLLPRILQMAAEAEAKTEHSSSVS